MITLHEAIRNIQDELIKSEQERTQKGIPPLFVTEKLTIELSCVFSETDSTDTKGGIKALSVLALDAASTSSVSLEEVQKIILEFRTKDSKTTQNTEKLQDAKELKSQSIPSHTICGMYPYNKSSGLS